MGDSNIPHVEWISSDGDYSPNSIIKYMVPVNLYRSADLFILESLAIGFHQINSILNEVLSPTILRTKEIKNGNDQSRKHLFGLLQCCLALPFQQRG